MLVTYWRTLQKKEDHLQTLNLWIFYVVCSLKGMSREEKYFEVVSL